MTPQQIMTEIERLQNKLNTGSITINAPCGNEPIVDLLGGIHARAAIHETRGKYPNTAQELETVKKLINQLL